MTIQTSDKPVVEKKSLRDAYGATLAELGASHPAVVVLDADLSGSTRTATFAKKYPDRFFNMGVAEANMIGVAAGMAVSGKIPFASTFAVFATGRAWEQIRQSVCLGNVNVKVVASHGGITVGEDGPSHQAMEDIALMRALPHMGVIVPADAAETASAVRFAADHVGPLYIRLARDKFPVVHREATPFRLGKGEVLRNGPDVALVGCGLMTSTIIEAADRLADEGIMATVVNMATIKPIDEELLITLATTCGAIVTAEEHSIIGGLGSAVAEVIGENIPVPVIKVGMKSEFGKSGPPEALLDYFGLNAAAVIEAAKKALALKNG
ncbi:MAG: transketolase family protein [Nitrospinae bacterium]|nr:transketolase family protein [Nitrospinota bacterium]